MNNYCLMRGKYVFGTIESSMYFQTREEAREVKLGLDKPLEWRISRGPDHPYIKASVDKGRHPKKDKVKSKFGMR